MNRSTDLAPGVHRPWATAGAVLRAPRYVRLGPGLAPVPVLLHHGFLIDENARWHGQGLVRRLLADGRDVVLLTEHFVREVDEARALGHDCELPLAESLELVIDRLGAAEVDCVADGQGCAPALIAAANDGRIRRLALRGLGCVPLSGSGAGTVIAPVGAGRPTFTEIDLGLECTHGDIEPLGPADGITLGLRDVTAATLLAGTSDDAAAVREFATLLPHATAWPDGGSPPGWSEAVVRFLGPGTGADQ